MVEETRLNERIKDKTLKDFYEKVESEWNFLIDHCPFFFNETKTLLLILEKGMEGILINSEKVITKDEKAMLLSKLQDMCSLVKKIMMDQFDDLIDKNSIRGLYSAHHNPLEGFTP